MLKQCFIFLILYSVFDDPALGMAQGHGMVLAMHLEKLLRGSQKFLPLMTTKFDNLDSIQCVRYIHEKLVSSPGLDEYKRTWHVESTNLG